MLGKSQEEAVSVRLLRDTLTISEDIKLMTVAIDVSPRKKAKTN